MANLKVKDADASDKYLKATGAGTDLDPHVVEHLDANSAAMLAALQAVQSAVELIDNVISGSEAQVDVVTSALPTGAATETTLAAIQTAVELIDNMISGSEAQVDVITSALPAGAATEATLTAIDAGKLEESTFTARIGEVQASPTAYTLLARLKDLADKLDTLEATNNAIQAAVEGTLSVDDAGGALTVDGTVTVQDGGGSLTVDGSVTASDGGGSLTVDNAGTFPVQVDAALPAGANQIGDVVVNDVEDGAGTSAMDTGNHALRVNVVAGSGSGVSHTDDAAFTAGSDDVVPAAGLYQSTPDQVDDGDAGALRMTQRRALLISHETPAGDSMVDDTNDALKVNVVAGSGSGVSHTDDAAFTPGSDDVVPAAGVYDDASPDQVDEGDAGAVRMSARRELYVQLRDAAGNERGLNVDADGKIGVTGAATETTLDAIKTAVELIDNMISGSEAQVDVVTSALPTGAATEATLADIKTAVELIDNMISGSEAQVDVVTSALPSGAATETTLSAIQTAVELIDNMISGSEAQVDVVASLPAGTNTIGNVGLAPKTSGGLSIFRSIDLDESEEEVKSTAGQVYGAYLYNAASSGMRYVKFYNATAATVVVGTTTPVLTLPLDAGQGAVLNFEHGIAFSTAITVAATTGVADSDTGAPAANEVIANIFYA